MQNKTQQTRTQIGGTHYSDNFKIQPIDLIRMCEWDFIQGNIAKYVLRYKYKNGVEDLLKAEDYCFIEEITGNYTKEHTCAIDVFCKINDIDAVTEGILHLIDKKEYVTASISINTLRESFEKYEKSFSHLAKN